MSEKNHNKRNWNYQMLKKQGIEVVHRMRARGFTLAGWARANGFCTRTLYEVLYSGLGSKRGGKKSKEILNALKKYCFLD